MKSEEYPEPLLRHCQLQRKIRRVIPGNKIVEMNDAGTQSFDENHPKCRDLDSET